MQTKLLACGTTWLFVAVSAQRLSDTTPSYHDVVGGPHLGHLPCLYVLFKMERVFLAIPSFLFCAWCN